jgi:hypothetical protein
MYSWKIQYLIFFGLTSCLLSGSFSYPKISIKVITCQKCPKYANSYVLSRKESGIFCIRWALSFLFLATKILILCCRVQHKGVVEIITNEQAHWIVPSWASFPDEKCLFIQPSSISRCGSLTYVSSVDDTANGDAMKNAFHTNPENRRGIGMDGYRWGNLDDVGWKWWCVSLSPWFMFPIEPLKIQKNLKISVNRTVCVDRGQNLCHVIWHLLFYTYNVNERQWIINNFQTPPGGFGLVIHKMER